MKQIWKSFRRVCIISRTYRYEVVSDSGVELGTLKDINTNTAQRVYEVARPGKPDILIPGVDEFILDTDMDNRVITVKVIEGLYED